MDIALPLRVNFGGGWSDTPPYCNENGGTVLNAAVTLNGARVITPSGTYENTISPESAVSILKQLYSITGTVISVETGNGIYANTDIPAWNPKVAEDVRTLPENEKIYKILASHPLLKPNRLRITEPEDVYSTVADQKLIQFMSKSATKWNGIRQVLREDRIPAEQVICFGDDNDDIEPIRMCGCGVAVSNALDNVKQTADAVAESNDNDGVAKYLAGLLQQTVSGNVRPDGSSNPVCEIFGRRAGLE